MVDDVDDSIRNHILFIDRGKGGARSLTNLEQLIEITNRVLLELKISKLSAKLFRADIEAKLHLREHVKLFQHSRIVVGPHGAGFYNVLWCKPFATTIMEVGYTTGMQVPEMYFEMSQHLDLEYYLIKGTGDYSGPIVADEKHFELAIKQALKKFI
jgi:capsular polysaccharide biosynthesis protein